MQNSLIKKVKNFVFNSFSKNSVEIYHAKRTAYWIKKLKDDAGEELIIAGFSHDIERAFFGDWKKGSSDKDKLKKHQQLSAKIISEFLTKEKADKTLIANVKRLVLHHETGGKEDENILCDADCLSYLEEKGIRLAKTYHEKGLTKKYVKQKLDYVMSRIHSEKAKNIAKKFYDKAKQQL